MTDTFRTEKNSRINFNILPDSLCPCGSGRAIEVCCLKDGSLFRFPSIVFAPLPKTGERLEACYATVLCDCSKSLSREHFISKSLLDKLNQNDSLTVEGFPWLLGEARILPPSALTSKTLCQRHNFALSNLDSIAVSFFEAFDKADVQNKNEERLFLFSGSDTERWLLKVLCGFAKSGNLATDRPADLSVPIEWVEALFGLREFSNNQGLYVCNDIGHVFSGPYGVALSAITNNARLTGLDLYVCGYEFILSMTGLKDRIFDGRKFVYRPFEFYYRSRNSEKSVLFSWGGVSDGGTIKSIIAG